MCQSCNHCNCCQASRPSQARWTDSNGRTKRVIDMDTYHIRNMIQYLKRNGYCHDPRISAGYAELNRRGC